MNTLEAIVQLLEEHSKVVNTLPIFTTEAAQFAERVSAIKTLFSQQSQTYTPPITQRKNAISKTALAQATIVTQILNDAANHLDDASIIEGITVNKQKLYKTTQQGKLMAMQLVLTRALEEKERLAPWNSTGIIEAFEANFNGFARLSGNTASKIQRRSVYSKALLEEMRGIFKYVRTTLANLVLIVESENSEFANFFFATAKIKNTGRNYKETRAVVAPVLPAEPKNVGLPQVAEQIVSKVATTQKANGATQVKPAMNGVGAE